MTSRRLALLSACALALTVGACAKSNGAAPPPNSTLTGIGVLPAQTPLGDGPVGSVGSVPTSILASDVQPAFDITDPKVFMEGDSVLRGMAIGTPDALDLYVGALGWNLTVDAQVGRFTDVGVANVKQRKNEVAQVVVAMLGNNYDGDQKAYADQVLDLLKSFPDVREFVMFTVPLYKPNRTQVNDVLHGVAALDHRLVLIDWERMSREIPGVLSSDRLHPTSYGADVLAQAVGITLGKAPGAGPLVTLPTFGGSTRPTLPPGTKTNKGENSNDNASRNSTATTVKRTATTAAAAPAPSTTAAATNPTTKPSATTAAPASTAATTTVTTTPTTGSPSTTAAPQPTPSPTPAPTQAPTTAEPATTSVGP